MFLKSKTYATKAKSNTIESPHHSLAGRFFCTLVSVVNDRSPAADRVPPAVGPPPAIRWRSQLIFVKNRNRAVVLTNVKCHCIAFVVSLDDLEQFSNTPNSHQRRYRVSCQLKPEDARAERAVTAVLVGVLGQPTARDDLARPGSFGACRRGQRPPLRL